MRKTSALLITLFVINVVVFVVTLGTAAKYPKDFHLMLEFFFVVPILLSLGSLKWKKYFSLYPAYLLGLAHIFAFFVWLVFILVTLGLALLIQIFSFFDTWIIYPLPLSLIFVQDFLWTALATPVLISGITGNSFSVKKDVLLPATILPKNKKVVFWLGVFFYIFFILAYYLFLLADYGFVPFFGPPS